MTTEGVSVAIFDPQPVAGWGLSWAISEQLACEVTFVPTIPIPLQLPLHLASPHLLIVDLEMGGQEATDLVRQVGAQSAGVRIVAFSSRFSDAMIEFALRLNFRGCLLKTEPLDRIITALRAVINGETVFSQTIMDRLSFNRVGQKFQVKTNCVLQGLTLRQLEVFKHLAEGESVKSVAEKLALTERSVESQKYRIMQKIGIHDRVLLTRFAIREGIIQP